MVVEEKGDMLSIKGPNKGENLRQRVSCHAKSLKDGSFKDGVESIYNIHL
jgi:hypothetical protein